MCLVTPHFFLKNIVNSPCYPIPIIKQTIFSSCSCSLKIWSTTTFTTSTFRIHPIIAWSENSYILLQQLYHLSLLHLMLWPLCAAVEWFHCSSGTRTCLASFDIWSWNLDINKRDLSTLQATKMKFLLSITTQTKMDKISK